MLRALKYITFITIIVCLAFCSTIDNYSSDTLANQGILPLSATDSYLGTNLFLAKQAEQSKVLYNFLESKGGPAAMELLDETFKAPRLLLYYPKTEEVYSAGLEDQTGIYEWMVRGPYAIKRTDFRKLPRNADDPLFVIHGKFKRFKVDREAALATPTPYPTLIPTPKPTARPTPRRIITAVPKGTAEIITAPKNTVAEPSIKDFRPLNSDQQAIQMSKGFAERADNGDVIHTVKTDGEKIEAISKWYTGGDAGAKEISSANDIPEGKELVKGQRIKIPLKILKNLKAMP
jgi:hypothetical protein